MTTTKQLEIAASEYLKDSIDPSTRGLRIHAFVNGGLKGMEIQKEIDRQEIERLKSCLVSIGLENYDDDDDEDDLKAIIDELKRFARENLKP